MNRADRWLVRAILDHRGASALEFALILPALLLLYIGAVELGNLLTIDRRVAEVASTAADLTAQVKTVSDSDLQDIATASSSILTPYSTTPLKMVVSSVVADANNTPKVDWSYATNGATARAKNSIVSLPPGLTQAQSGVVMTEVTYDFTPLVGLPKYSPVSAFVMSKTFYERPRKSLTVKKTN
jgi:Flp pilus assembly protein TadG